LQSTELQLQSERRSRMMSERRLEEVTNQLQAKIALGRGHRTMGTLGEQAASISIGTQTDVDLSNLSPVPRYRGAGKRKPTTAVSEELRSVVERRGWGEGETTQQVDNAEETSNPTESKLLMRASEIYKAKEQPSAEVDDPVEDTEHDPSTPNAKRKATLAEFSLGMEGHEAAVRDSYDPSLEQQDAEELLHDVLGDDDDDDDDDDIGPDDALKGQAHKKATAMLGKMGKMGKALGSVKGDQPKVLGTKAKKYFKNLLQDIKGEITGDDGDMGSPPPVGTYPPVPKAPATERSRSSFEKTRT